MKKNNSGITLVALIITIIVLLIIISISVYEGKEIIAKSKVQTIETNMLTVQSKAKAYAEEIDAKIWTESDKDTARDAEFTSAAKAFTGPVNNINQDALQQVSTEITSNYVAYQVTGNALTIMGLDEIKDETYIVIYSKENYKLMDVIYPESVSYKNNTYYTLSALQEVL